MRKKHANNSNKYKTARVISDAPSIPERKESVEDYKKKSFRN